MSRTVGQHLTDKERARMVKKVAGFLAAKRKKSKAEMAEALGVSITTVRGLVAEATKTPAEPKAKAAPAPKAAKAA